MPLISNNMTTSLYGDLLAAHVLMDHHESDLYFADCAAGRELLWRYPRQLAQAKRFYDSDGNPWWDVPFAYLPWWAKRLGVEV